MKKAREFIKFFIFAELGIAAGKSIAAYSHYKRHPKYYETLSSPWYTQLLASLLITAIIVVISVIVYMVLGKIIKKGKQRKTNK